jgi:hypothetical protein
VNIGSCALRESVAKMKEKRASRNTGTTLGRVAKTLAQECGHISRLWLFRFDESASLGSRRLVGPSDRRQAPAKAANWEAEGARLFVPSAIRSHGRNDPSGVSLAAETCGAGAQGGGGDRVEKPRRMFASCSPSIRLGGFLMKFRGPKAHSNRPGSLSAHSRIDHLGRHLWLVPIEFPQIAVKHVAFTRV